MEATELSNLFLNESVALFPRQSNILVFLFNYLKSRIVAYLLTATLIA